MLEISYRVKVLSRLLRISCFKSSRFCFSLPEKNSTQVKCFEVGRCIQVFYFGYIIIAHIEVFQFFKHAYAENTIQFISRYVQINIHKSNFSRLGKASRCCTSSIVVFAE